MADNGHAAATDDELTLPRATVAKLINGKTKGTLIRRRATLLLGR